MLFYIVHGSAVLAAVLFILLSVEQDVCWSIMSEDTSGTKEENPSSQILA